jgi:hypothetical protein
MHKTKSLDNLGYFVKKDKDPKYKENIYVKENENEDVVHTAK